MIDAYFSPIFRCAVAVFEPSADIDAELDDRAWTAKGNPMRTLDGLIMVRLADRFGVWDQDVL